MIFTISNIGFAFKTHNPLLNNLSTIFMMRTFVDLCGILLISLQETQRYEHYLHNDLMQMNNTSCIKPIVRVRKQLIGVFTI